MLGLLVQKGQRATLGKARLVRAQLLQDTLVSWWSLVQDMYWVLWSYLLYSMYATYVMWLFCVPVKSCSTAEQQLWLPCPAAPGKSFLMWAVCTVAML